MSQNEASLRVSGADFGLILAGGGWVWVVLVSIEGSETEVWGWTPTSVPGSCKEAREAQLHLYGVHVDYRRDLDLDDFWVPCRIP